MALYVRGRQTEAIEPLKQAVALDPNIAMAYRNLSAIHRNRGRMQEAEAFWQKAMALKDQGSERQRLLLEGQDYQFKGQFKEALTPLAELLERWPEDLLGQRLTYMVHAGLGNQDKAIEHLLQVVRLFPESALDCANLAAYYWRRREYKKAEKILSAYAEDIPDSITNRVYLSCHFCLTNDFDRALEELEIAARLDPARSFTGHRFNIYFAKDDLAAYSQRAAELLESDQEGDQAQGRLMIRRLHRMQGRLEDAKRLIREDMDWRMAKKKRTNLPWHHLNLAVLELESGDFQAALEESREALRAAGEIKNRSARKWALVLEGQVLLALSAIEEARKTADELGSRLKEESDEREMKMLYWLEGLIQLESGHQKKAIEALEQAESLLRGYYSGMAFHMEIVDNVFYHDALGQAYFRSGKWGPAEARYEKISTTGLFRLEPEIWVKSFYWLGRIADERGKEAEARKHYQKFLELWKDADPDIPVLMDAKQRLAGQNQ